jgi:hypothetical protein
VGLSLAEQLLQVSWMLLHAAFDHLICHCYCCCWFLGLWVLPVGRFCCCCLLGMHGPAALQILCVLLLSHLRVVLSLVEQTLKLVAAMMRCRLSTVCGCGFATQRTLAVLLLLLRCWIDCSCNGEA